MRLSILTAHLKLLHSKRDSPGWFSAKSRSLNGQANPAVPGPTIAHLRYQQGSKGKLGFELIQKGERNDHETEGNRGQG